MQVLVEAQVWDLRVIDFVEEFLRLAHISNEAVSSLVEKYPRRFVGLGSSIPEGLNYVKNKLAEVDRLKLDGVKLIPTLQLFDLLGMRRL